jgi:mannose-1-phosphate guanylyltransferase/mannose-6-phosphate isomerase
MRRPVRGATGDQMRKIQPVIMCGGSGTRVWPESRETLPKQFIPLVGERSTFQTTMQMLADPAFEKPIVISNKEYRFLLADQLREIGAEADIVLEPSRRDSGPAVAVAAGLVARRSPETVVVVLAADHVVRDRAGLVELCKRAGDAAAQGFIVTLGIRPDSPATGYGYLRPGAPIEPGGEVLRLDSFVEKPDRETAQGYIDAGYFWNSGNFIFRADVMRDEIAHFEPAIAEAAEAALDAAERDLGFLVLNAEAFARAPKKSIDYAVMEKTEKAALIPADIGWSDVGTWRAVWELSDRDESGNSVRGNAVVMNSRNVHVRSEDTLTTVVGVDDVIVVTTQDAVLVLSHEHGDQVKQLVDQLKAENRREAGEHKRIFRPWGYYQSIDGGQRYQVKRIVVKPGERLSLQKHFHRAEHWIVVRGTAEVGRDEETHLVHENESIYLPIGCRHRLTNPGKIDLELIEVQTGSYLGEDDIVRFEDVYNRG